MRIFSSSARRTDLFTNEDLIEISSGSLGLFSSDILWINFRSEAASEALFRYLVALKDAVGAATVP